MALARRASTANPIARPVFGLLYDVGLIYTRVSQNMKEIANYQAWRPLRTAPSAAGWADGTCPVIFLNIVEKAAGRS